MFIDILRHRIPDTEQENSIEWLKSIEHLERYMRNFANDLGLFDYAFEKYEQSIDQQLSGFETLCEQYASWRFIAARDGALQIYHFGKILEQLSSQLHGCPTLSSYIDKGELKLANKLFISGFYDVIEVRDNVGHQAQVLLTPERNATKTEIDLPLIHVGAGAMFTDVLHERKYLVTHFGKAAFLEISDESLEKLRNSLDKVTQTLNPILRHAESLLPDQKLTPKE